jgi:tetratricopeptide (TPR) repeat protein
MNSQEKRMDPDNPVVKLCAEGMRAETEGRYADARALFERAWLTSQDDYEACIAAHYVARLQESLEDNLRWNQEALHRAEAVGDERVQDFYPSLYLNLGKSHEDLGNMDAARHCYAQAATCVGNLPAGPYTELVQKGITAAQKRAR